MILPESLASLPGNRLSLCQIKGFTLLELMVATAVFMMLVVVLATTLNQALGVWTKNENKSDLRESARTAINIMASELKQAALPVYRADQGGLQMVINPLSVTYRNRDCIFWQAPIATSQTKGDLAIVGYYVKNVGNTWKLCRLFINPDDPDYLLYSGGDWVTTSLLDTKAPATEASNLEGVFLDNVPGMWITAYDNAGVPYSSSPGFDSRVEKRLPARIDISLVLLDKSAASRVQAGVTLPASSGSTSAEAYLNSLPASIRPNAQAITVSVSFLFRS